MEVVLYIHHPGHHRRHRPHQIYRHLQSPSHHQPQLEMPPGLRPTKHKVKMSLL